MVGRYEQADRKARKILKERGYKVLDVECCMTCECGGQMSLEDPFTCSEAQQPGFTTGEVDELGWCSKYRRRWKK